MARCVSRVEGVLLSPTDIKNAFFFLARVRMRDLVYRDREVPGKLFRRGLCPNELLDACVNA